MYTIGIVIAADVAEEISYGQAAWVLEVGGLLLLFGSVAAILLGLFQGGEDHGASRSIGYGVAMAAAAGMSLYASVSLGGDPVAVATGSTWLYAVAAMVGCLLYASYILNQAQRRPRRSRVGAARTQANQGYMTEDDVTQPRTSPRSRQHQAGLARAHRK